MTQRAVAQQAVARRAVARRAVAQQAAAQQEAAQREATGWAQAEFQLERTLTYRLHVLHKLSDRNSAAAYRDGAALTMSEGRCLAAIGAFAPLSVNDLAQRANLDKGQASRAAQTLVDRAFVAKNASAQDARGVVLTLTRAGRLAWKRVVAVIEQRNHEIFSRLNAEERLLLGDMFDRLIEHARSSPEDAEVASPG